MFAKLIALQLMLLLIITINAELKHFNCDFDLLDDVSMSDEQKIAIEKQFPVECLNLNDADKHESIRESKKFAEFKEVLSIFDPDQTKIDEYDQFYEPTDVLKCNNETMSYAEYIDCVILKRGDMIELIENVLSVP